MFLLVVVPVLDFIIAFLPRFIDLYWHLILCSSFKTTLDDLMPPYLLPVKVLDTSLLTLLAFRCGKGGEGADSGG